MTTSQQYNNRVISLVVKYGKESTFGDGMHGYHRGGIPGV
jgi:hypothetical protein